LQSIINFLIAHQRYGDSIRYIQTVINDHQAEDSASAYYIHARMMNLIVQYELKNFDLLDSLIRSVEFYLHSRKIELNFTTILLRGIKQLNKVESDSREILRRMGEQFQILQNFPVERIHLNGFLESQWLLRYGVKVELQPQPVFM
jgi:hypothetical protein